MISIRQLGVPLILVTLVVCDDARPQNGGTPGVDSPAHAVTGTLAGHRFITNSSMPDPFVRTYLRTDLGFGRTPDLKIPLLSIDGQTVIGIEGSILLALMSFEYQQAVREWLAVRGSVRVVGRLADETRPLIAQGVTLFSGFSLGWLARITESDRLSLSTSLEFRNSSYTDVYLRRFIEGIIENGALTPGNRLVETTPSLQAGAGLHGAYAVNELVGLTLSGTLLYGESVDRGDPDAWYYDIGGAIDLNLYHHGGPPLGFVAGVKVASIPFAPGTGARTSETYFGRIGYTGARDFDLGLDLGYNRFPVRNFEEKQSFGSGSVDIRLYF